MSNFTPFDQGNCPADRGDQINVRWNITARSTVTNEVIDVRLIYLEYSVLKKGIATGLIWESLTTGYPVLAWLDGHEGDAKCKDIGLDQPFSQQVLDGVESGDLIVEMECV